MTLYNIYPAAVVLNPLALEMELEENGIVNTL